MVASNPSLEGSMQPSPLSPVPPLKTSKRFRHILVLSAAFLLLFSCHNTFLFSAVSMYPKDVSQNIVKILTISYGVCNAFTGFAVARLAYRTAFLTAGALSLPFYAVAAVAKKRLATTPASETQPASSALLWALYGSCGVCGLGQSMLWIAQGCYITNTTAPADMSTAYAIFNVAYNLTVCVGSGYMALNGSVDCRTKNNASYAKAFWTNDIVSLFLLCSLAVLGVALFGLLPTHGSRETRSDELPLSAASATESRASEQQPPANRRPAFRAQLKILLRNFVAVSLVVPAMSFLGVIITFSNVALQTFVSDNENRFQYITTAVYGLAMTLNSCVQWAFVRPRHLKACIAAAFLFQAACYTSLLLFDVAAMQPSNLKRFCVLLFTVLLGVGDSFFINGFYTFLSLRYEAIIGFAMAVFMVLNGVFGGVLAESFSHARWGTILLILSLPTYGGIFLELQLVKLK